MSKEPLKPSGKSPLAFGANLYFLLLVFTVSLIMFRVWNLVLFNSSQYQEVLSRKLYSDSTISVLRGTIMSEEGDILATTIPYYDLTLDMSVAYLNKKRKSPKDKDLLNRLQEYGVKVSKDKEGGNWLDLLASKFSGKKEKKTKTIFQTELEYTAELLAKMLGERNKEEYEKLLTKWYKDAQGDGPKPSGYRYRVLKKNVDYKTYEKLRNEGIFCPEKGHISCLSKREHYKPVYPYGNLAMRTIGKIPTEEENKNKKLFRAQTGIQYSYNSYLAGITGKVKRKRLGKNAYLTVDDENNILPQNGSDVVTTIDVNMQDMVESELRKTLTNHRAEFGTAVVMEVATGKIKAMANLGYDTSRSGYYELENYAIRRRFEPGSTFKLASLMAAMEKEGLTPDDRVDIEGGTAKVGGMLVRDAGHGKAESNLSIQQVFERSSNVGVAKTIYRLFEQRENKVSEFLETINTFGLLTKTGVDLNGEEAPTTFTPIDKRWTRNYSLIKLSFGYFFEFTPLQILNFYNTVANNGKQLKPYLVSEVRYLDQTIEQFEPKVINPKICSDKTLKWAHQLMVGVALNGTAKGRDSLEFYYAGKTGTVQIWNNPKDKIPNNPENSYLFPDGQGGWTNRHQVSFVGYFPKDKPTYSIITLINYPKTPEPTGGGIAVPLFKEIAKKIYAGSLNYQFRALPTPTRVAISNLYHGQQSDLAHLLKRLKFPYNIQKEEVIAKVSVNGGKYILQGTRMPENAMPDLIGMNLRDALYLLESRGIRPRINGKGRIVSQSINAGSPLRRGMPLQLELSL